MIELVEEMVKKELVLNDNFSLTTLFPANKNVVINYASVVKTDKNINDSSIYTDGEIVQGRKTSVIKSFNIVCIVSVDRKDIKIYINRFNDKFDVNALGNILNILSMVIKE